MSTPAGWYDDPGSPPGSGQLRWWDGSTWTAHTRSRVAGSGQPQQGQYGQQQPQYGQQQYGEQGQWGQQGQYAGYSQYTGYATYGTKPTHTPDGVPLGNIGLRLLGKIIDGVLLGLLTVLATLPTWPGMIRATERYSAEIDRLARSGGTPDIFALYADPEYQRFVVWSAVASLVISVLYTVLLLRFKGATVGKLVTGLRVRRWDDGGQLRWGQCVARWAVESLPQALCGFWFIIDDLWCVWDSRRQTLHDKAAGTVVVKR